MKSCQHDWVVHPDDVTDQKRCPDCGCYPVNDEAAEQMKQLLPDAAGKENE